MLRQFIEGFIADDMEAAAVDELVAVFGVLPIEPHPVPQRVAVAGDAI